MLEITGDVFERLAPRLNECFRVWDDPGSRLPVFPSSRPGKPSCERSGMYTCRGPCPR
jgi:hypothetical protein